MTRLGIQRPQYAALSAPDPEAAARFAVEAMGFSLAQVDGEGRHYLRAIGADAYSLVYCPVAPGQDPGIDHLTYLVPPSAFDDAGAVLSEQGVECTYDGGSGLWNARPGWFLRTPSGVRIRLTTGVPTPVPMAAATPAPAQVPGPICCDHIVPRTPDVERELEFVEDVLGLRRSATITAPDVGTVLAFFRGGVLFHCLAVARGSSNGLHHVQFTVKSPPHVYAAAERVRATGGLVEWGPLRHGPGHNIAFYFRDAVGNIVEYSCEEEIILDDATYAAREWSITDQKALDEWGSRPPPTFFA